MSSEPTGTDLVFARASLRDRMDWSKAIAAAGELVPVGLRNRDGSPNPAKILLVAETGSMLQVHPMAAIQGIHVIEGKTTLSAGLMSALVRRAGHKLRITKKGTVAGGDYEATAVLIRADDPTFEYRATWNLERAKRAGLAGKGNWNKYFEAQCKARAISEVVREGAEDVLMGNAYTPEDFGAVMTDQGELMREDLIEDAEEVPPATVFPTAQYAEAIELETNLEKLHGLWTELLEQDALDTAHDGATLRERILSRKGYLEERAKTPATVLTPDTDSSAAYDDEVPF